MSDLNHLATIGGTLTLSFWSEDERVFTEARRDAWAKTFKHWKLIVEMYQGITDDLAWWNTETSGVSLLASAIWKADTGVALQEFPAVRWGDGGRPRGRADLWATVGGASYLLEAKRQWLNAASRSPGDLLAAGLENAVREAKSYLEHHDFRGGILFAPVFSRIVVPDPEHLIAWRKQAAVSFPKVAGHGVIAEYFPSLSDDQIYHEAEDEYHPGTLIVLGFDPKPKKS
jgi:hypothetical protein